MQAELYQRVFADFLSDLQEYFNKSDAGVDPLVLLPLRRRIDDEMSSLIFNVDDRDAPTSPGRPSPIPPGRPTPGPWSNADVLQQAKRPKR